MRAARDDAERAARARAARARVPAAAARPATAAASSRRARGGGSVGGRAAAAAAAAAASGLSRGRQYVAGAAGVAESGGVVAARGLGRRSRRAEGRARAGRSASPKARPNTPRARIGGRVIQSGAGLHLRTRAARRQNGLR